MLTTLIVENVLSNNDGDGYENVTLSEFSLLPTLSYLFHLVQSIKCWHFLWSWILKDFIEVQEKKRNVVVLRSRAPQNVKMGIFMS